MDSAGISGQLDTVDGGARETPGGRPVGQIQFACVLSIFAI